MRVLHALQRAALLRRCGTPVFVLHGNQATGTFLGSLTCCRSPLEMPASIAARSQPGRSRRSQAARSRTLLTRTQPCERKRYLASNTFFAFVSCIYTAWRLGMSIFTAPSAFQVPASWRMVKFGARSPDQSTDFGS